jgi:hypothetical protein
MQNLVIDISRRGVIPPIIVTEYDSMSRFFELRLLNNGADYVPPENANYSVWYETNDSKGWYDTITLPDETSRPAVVEDGNVLTVEIAEAATTSCGELAVMVTGDGGYQLTVSGIRLMSADVPGYDGAEVEDYYNVYIADMQKNAARAENAAQTAIEYGATIDVDEAEEELIIDHYDDAGEVETWATVSEAWAVGKRNGVDVPSTDETYHNNSKYYAGQAANSAVNAAASAETAEEAAELCFTTAIKTSASGAVASFSDGADDVPMKSIVAEITPVQSGSGDPSPTNIRPISGRTGLTVTREGKNIAKPIATTATLAGVSWAVTDDGKVTASGTATGNTQVNFNYANNVLQLPKNVPLIISGSTDKLAVRVCYRTTDAPSTTVTLATSYDGADATGTIPDNAKDAWVRVLDIAGTGVAVNAECYPMVRISGNADYEPYTAQEYPITWESIAGTVYGGTLDVVSGVLTVTDALIASYDGETLPSTWISDRDIYAAGTTPTTGAQVVYKLATPQTYQLTPTEVRTLLGGNNIYTDAGDVSVEYIADTKMYIDNKIAALQALVLENN